MFPALQADSLLLSAGERDQIKSKDFTSIKKICSQTCGHRQGKQRWDELRG